MAVDIQTTFDVGQGTVEVQLFDPTDLAGGSVIPETTADEPAAAGVPWTFTIATPDVPADGLYHASFFDADGELIRTGACLFDGNAVIGVGDFAEMNRLYHLVGLYEADVDWDTSNPAHFSMVWKRAGTAVELLRKKVYNSANNAFTSFTQIVRSLRRD